MKVAIPTDDGVRISRRFGRAGGFIVAEVGLGAIIRREHRDNPAAARVSGNKAGLQRPRRNPDRHALVAETIGDCDVIITGAIGQTMRKTLTEDGKEIVITSERILDRALALFTLVSLKDESRGLPEAGGGHAGMFGNDTGDEFDG